MKKIEKEILIKIIISIVFIVLTIITSFNSGRKFYELKNTIMNNYQKTKIDFELADFNFNVKFIIGDRVFEIE